MRYYIVPALLFLLLPANDVNACAFDHECTNRCLLSETARCVLPRFEFQGGTCLCFVRNYSNNLTAPLPVPTVTNSSSQRRVMPLVVTQDNRVQAHMLGMGTGQNGAPPNLSKLGSFMEGYYQGQQRALDLQIRQQQLRQLQIQNSANQQPIQQPVRQQTQRTHQQAIEAAKNLAHARHMHPKLFEDQYRGLPPAQRREVDELLELARANNLYPPSPSETSNTPPSSVNTAGANTASSQPQPASNNYAVPTRPTIYRTIVNTNVLASPNLLADVIAEIPHGTTLTMLSQENHWLLVELPNGQQGYLFSQDVEQITP